MRRSRCAARVLATCVAMLGLTGCPSDPPPTDGGPGDGGRLDSGGEVDSGIEDDGGGPVDGGPGDAGLPSAAPTTFTEVASAGFVAPSDAVASPDGSTFYFAAFTEIGEPAIFTVASSGGSVMLRHAGAPLAYPSGLVLSCDGTTLYVADPGADDGTGELGAVFTMPVAGTSAPTDLGVTGIEAPSALAVSHDCTQLAISGRTASGEAVIARAPIAGGAATAVATGGALRAPTGLYWDADNVIWALDHLAEGSEGQGVLYNVDATGMLEEAASGLLLGTPGGVSLTAGGGNAVVGGRRADGAAILTVIDVLTGAASETTLPAELLDPAGLRTARAAGVFAIVDSEGGAIWRGN